MSSSLQTATIVGSRSNPASRSASWKRASRTMSCAVGGSGGRGGRRRTKWPCSRSSKNVKFEPPPSPIRVARTRPEPSPCESRNAATRSRTTSGGRSTVVPCSRVSTTSTLRCYAAMRRRLYLIRHAEVSYVGERDPEVVRLTERGLEQAAAARRALDAVALDLVVTSTLPRTIETAEVVAPAANAEAWPEFAEWRGGRLTEIPAEERERAFVGALLIRDEDERFIGGESLGEALDRVLPAFDRLVAREWDTALAVLHGGVNRILISRALTGERRYFGTFEQAPACINVLDLGDSEWIVRTVNYIPYDPLHPARTTTMEQYWDDLRGWLDERAG